MERTTTEQWPNVAPHCRRIPGRQGKVVFGFGRWYDAAKGRRSMGDFFKGWQRKTGCVALMMACVVAGMWFRSWHIEESAGVFAGGRKYVLYSHDGELGFLFASPTEKAGFQTYWWSRESHHTYRLAWRLQVAYVDVAIPLTLVSACLILWKPRMKAANTTKSDGVDHA